MPPRGIGVGAPPSVPNSYTNRKQPAESVVDNEQGRATVGALDFVTGMMKRDILSQPKTSANHERSSHQVLIENRKAGSTSNRKSPIRMSQDMASHQLNNRNRILKPVADQQSSAAAMYGGIPMTDNANSSRHKLLKSTDRLEQFSSNKEGKKYT